MVEKSGKLDTLGLIYYYRYYRLSNLGFSERALVSSKLADKYFTLSNYNGGRKARNLTMLSYYFKDNNQLDSASYYLAKVIFDKPNKDEAWMYMEAIVAEAEIFFSQGEYMLAYSSLKRFLETEIYKSLEEKRRMDYLIIFAEISSFLRSEEISKEALDNLIKAERILPIYNNLEERTEKYAEIQTSKFNVLARLDRIEEAIVELIALEQELDNFQNNQSEEHLKLFANFSFAYEKTKDYSLMLKYASKSMSVEEVESVLNDFVRNHNFSIALMLNDQFSDAANLIDSSYAILGLRRNEINLSSPYQLEQLNLLYEEARLFFRMGQNDKVIEVIEEFLKLAYYRASKLLLNGSLIQFKEEVYPYAQSLLQMSYKINSPEFVWKISELLKSTLILRDLQRKANHNLTFLKQNEIANILDLKFDSIARLDGSMKSTIDEKNLDKQLLGLFTSLNIPLIEQPLLNDIRDDLKSEDLILSYHFTEDSLLRILITGYGLRVESLGNSQKIKASIQKIVNSLQRPEYSFDKNMVYELRSLLFGGLKKEIDKLIIIPHQELSLLPLSLLVDDHFEIANKGISSYFSSHLFHMKHKQEKSSKDNHYFLPSYAQNELSNKHSLDNLGRLPFSTTEVNKIQKKVKGLVLQGEKVTKSNFVSAMHQNGILHFSGHTIASSSEDGGFMLALDNKISDLSNVVSNIEISTMTCNSSMVVLSACQSGTGNIFMGEGINSISRSFMQAGAASVVQTLWKVDDQSTSEIFISFYKYLKKGHRKSESLALAQKEYLKSSPDYKTHPYYWAGIVVIGNDDPLFFPWPFSHWALLLLCLLVGAIILYFTILRKK